MPKQPQAITQEENEVEDAEAKQQRKAAKRAAKEAAAALEAEEPTQVEAEADEAEAKRLRKAAKKAAKVAAEALETTKAMEVDEDEAKRQRKAARKAAKEVAAAAIEEQTPETAKKAGKGKRRDATDGDGAEEMPVPKKAKNEEEEKANEQGNGKGKGKGEERDNTNTVFVRGFPITASEETLRKDFAACGEIENFRMPLSSFGVPKGICFIKYTSAAGVEAALKFEGTEYGGKTLQVSKAGEGGNVKDAKVEERSYENTVYIRSLPFSATEELVKKDFAECGEIETFKLPLNEEGKVRGICFIKYTFEAGVEAALKFDNTEYGGRVIHVVKAGENYTGNAGKGKSKGKDERTENTVFLKGLPFSATEETLRKDFSECGEIESLKLPLNEEKQSRGICFIKYTTEAGCEAALKFDSTEYGGRKIIVTRAGEGAKGKDAKGKGKDKDGKGKGKDGKGKKGKGKSKTQ